VDGLVLAGALGITLACVGEIYQVALAHFWRGRSMLCHYKIVG
jgi:hypothetical protein